MPKLHLVGITPDHKGLVLSEHARSKRGDLVLEIDERLIEAIEKANRLRAREEGRALESAALPSRRGEDPGDGTPATRLSPREIQQRLRMGETVASLARSSGVDEAWIERFASPVLAEKARIVERARASTFVRPRVGPSGATLGPAVAANVIDKGVPLALPDIEEGWAAFQRPGGEWCVTFSFPYRGRRQTAEWEFHPATGELTARGKLAAELAYREPGKRLPQPAASRPAAATRAPAAPGGGGRRAVAAGKAAETEGTREAPAVEAGGDDASGPQTLPGTAGQVAGGDAAPGATPGASGLHNRPGPGPGPAGAGPPKPAAAETEGGRAAGKPAAKKTGTAAKSTSGKATRPAASGKAAAKKAPAKATGAVKKPPSSRPAKPAPGSTSTTSGKAGPDSSSGAEDRSSSAVPENVTPGSATTPASPPDDKAASPSAPPSPPDDKAASPSVPPSPPDNTGSPSGSPASPAADDAATEAPPPASTNAVSPGDDRPSGSTGVAGSLNDRGSPTEHATVEVDREPTGPISLRSRPGPDPLRASPPTRPSR